MISFCIPIYNYDVSDLVDTILYQIKLSEVDCEIILIDDASEQYYKDLHTKYQNTTKYIQLDKNVGRAVIRNKFYDYAKYDYLLFLDCDSQIISSNFITRYYYELLSSKADVVCGGRYYSKKRRPKHKRLRHKYGLKYESKDIKVRMKKPYKSFMTNNFLIKKDVFKNIKFDENITKYGHEDTLFGYELKKNNVKIHHFNNLIVDKNLENNEEFLNKTEIGIINLIHINKNLNFEKDFIKDVKILNVYSKLFFLKPFLKLLFFINKGILRYLFINGIVILPFFSFYKLGYLSANYNRILKDNS